jgi:hypothetical protein
MGCSVRQDSRLAFSLASLTLFVLLASVHTWPLATAPGRLSRNDAHDTVHHEWILAWVAHQLPHDPRHLFDANIFYPERDTLAYSDHLIVQAIVAAPLLWSGASPVLAYNLLLVAGLALTGWTTSFVVGQWTGSRLAGILGGSLMAFNAITLTRVPEIQDQHLEFFPLTLWALDRLLAAPRVRHAMQLAGWFVLQALTCGYWLVFTSLALVAAVVVRPADWTGPRFRRAAGLLMLSAGVAVLALTPFLLPYLRVSRDQGFTWSLADVSLYSARLTDYLATGGRLHFSAWSNRFFDGKALFPGVIASGLALTALVGGVAWRDRRARMAVAFGVVAFALSFGPGFPLYGALCRVFPIMAGIRDASRFGHLFLAAIALLAGFGLALLQQRLEPAGASPTTPAARSPVARTGWASRRAVAIGLVLVLGVHVEALRAPFQYRGFDGIPPIFDSLRTDGREVIACFPFPQPGEAFLNVDCMLASTRFWQPLVNGYSSFTPQRYVREAAALDAFPEGTTLQYLRQLGVTHVIVFTDRLSPPRVAHLDEHPELSLWKADKAVRIYLLK